MARFTVLYTLQTLEIFQESSLLQLPVPCSHGRGRSWGWSYGYSPRDPPLFALLRDLCFFLTSVRDLLVAFHLHLFPFLLGDDNKPSQTPYHHLLQAMYHEPSNRTAFWLQGLEEVFKYCYVASTCPIVSNTQQEVSILPKNESCYR